MNPVFPLFQACFRLACGGDFRLACGGGCLSGCLSLACLFFSALVALGNGLETSALGHRPNTTGVPFAFRPVCGLFPRGLPPIGIRRKRAGPHCRSGVLGIIPGLDAGIAAGRRACALVARTLAGWRRRCLAFSLVAVGKRSVAGCLLLVGLLGGGTSETGRR